MTEDPSFFPPEPTAGEPRLCPWCSTPAPDGETHCSACGASLAQRESLEGVEVPGVTGVDPALQDALTVARIGRRSKAGLIGPLAMLAPEEALGALAAGAVIKKAQDLIASLEAAEQPVGEVPPAARLVAERLDRKTLEAGTESPPEGQASADSLGEAGAETQPAPPQDPWFDLPPRELDPWAEPAPDPWAGAQTDPWAGQSDPWAGQSDPWSTEGGPWSRDPWQEGGATPGPGPDDSPARDSDGPASGAAADSRR